MTESNTQKYQVKTAVFEGPLEVLLNLIEDRKLFINEISLAQVTDDYISYIKELGAGNLSNVSDVTGFIIIAATLILIKSKSLLPNLDLTDQEKGDIKNLEERLRLYELFTRLGGNIKNTFGKKIIFAPLERKQAVLVFLPDSQITPESMMTFAREVLGGMPKKVFLPEAEVKKVISIEEMIDKLSQRIQTAMKINFSEFSGKKNGPHTREEKVTVIVGFLAMLELVRNGILEAVQHENSGEIEITKQQNNQ